MAVVVVGGGRRVATGTNRNDVFELGSAGGRATLTGAGGDDLYRYAIADLANTRTDVITDFDRGDRLRVELPRVLPLPPNIEFVDDGDTTRLEFDADFLVDPGPELQITLPGQLDPFSFTGSFEVVDGTNVLEFELDGDSDGGATVVVGGAQDDDLVGGSGSDLLVGAGGDDRLRGLGSADRLEGGPGNDRLAGGRGADELIGNGGADVIDGNRGNDSLGGGRGGDQLSGNRGADELSGARGPDVLRGGPGNDTLLGGPGNDVMNGGLGDDVLIGGRGADLMTGGAGADRFVWRNAAQGVDRVADFADTDVLDIAAALPDLDPASDDLSAFVRLRPDGANTVLEIDPGGGADYRALATLAGLPELSLEGLLGADALVVE